MISEADNIIQEIAICSFKSGEIRFRDNGIISAEIYEDDIDMCIQIDPDQMKKIGYFLLEAANRMRS